MNPEELSRTIYLGDRGFDEIIIDLLNATIKIRIDLISRIRSPDGQWNFYQDENVAHGLLVFSGVQHFTMNSKGLLPNDYILDFNVKPLDSNLWMSTFIVAGLNGMQSENVELSIGMEGLHIETPAGEKVRS